MSERRYSEHEVAEIFERATEAQKASLPASRGGEGLTLAELQDVGKEVGLPPELVARAARSLASAGQPQDRKILGVAVGVGRTVELDRPLTDEEWNQLVVDLRETFDARGKLIDQGAFKQWTNGNLQALLEPTPTGQRLRLKTFKGSAMSMVTAGVTLMGIAGVMLLVDIVGGDRVEALRGMLILGTMGIGMIAAGALQLPSWARLRRRQMEGVAERLALTTSSSSTDDSP